MLGTILGQIQTASLQKLTDAGRLGPCHRPMPPNASWKRGKDFAGVSSRIYTALIVRQENGVWGSQKMRKTFWIILAAIFVVGNVPKAHAEPSLVLVGAG